MQAQMRLPCLLVQCPARYSPGIPLVRPPSPCITDTVGIDLLLYAIHVAQRHIIPQSDLVRSANPNCGLTLLPDAAATPTSENAVPAAAMRSIIHSCCYPLHWFNSITCLLKPHLPPHLLTLYHDETLLRQLNNCPETTTSPTARKQVTNNTP